jgi:hypothetical protein
VREVRNAFKMLAGKPHGKKPPGDLIVDGRTLLKWILEEQSVRMWSEFIWRTGYSGGFL